MHTTSHYHRHGTTSSPTCPPCLVPRFVPQELIVVYHDTVGNNGVLELGACAF
jgi:hypothetical protein